MYNWTSTMYWIFFGTHDHNFSINAIQRKKMQQRKMQLRKIRQRKMQQRKVKCRNEIRLHFLWDVWDCNQIIFDYYDHVLSFLAATLLYDCSKGPSGTEEGGRGGEEREEADLHICPTHTIPSLSNLSRTYVASICGNIISTKRKTSQSIFGY